MRVALTGASGFTGRHVAAALDAAGVEWVPLSVDLRDKDAVNHAVADASFERIIHLAGHAFVGVSDWAPFYHVNQLGTFNLLDAIARTQPGTRCIIASSAQVYGPGAEGLISEDAPTSPANHYAISKLSMEQGTGLWRDRLEIVVTRPFNYTGVGQANEYLIPKIVDHFQRLAPVIELGNTWVKRDFGDVRSVAAAYTGLVMADAPPPLVNLCTGIVRSIGEIVETLTALSGHTLEIRVNPAFVRTNDVPVLGGDATRLRTALPEWQPGKLAETLEWMYRAN